MKLQASNLQVFLKQTPTQVLSCEVCETFRNTYFEENLQATASGGVPVKKLFLKTLQYSQDESSDMYYVKKLFLVVHRAVKVTCFYNDQYLL